MRALWADSSPAVAVQTHSSLPFSFPAFLRGTNSSSRSSMSEASAATSFPNCCVFSWEFAKEMDSRVRDPRERALVRSTPNTEEISKWGSKLLKEKVLPG